VLTVSRDGGTGDFLSRVIRSAKFKVGCVGLLVLGACAPGQSAELTENLSVGARSGFAPSVKGEFRQTEAFGNWTFPGWLRSTNFTIRPRLEGTAGYLESGGQYGFVGTVGPDLLFEYLPSRVALDLGVHATLLSRDTYPSRDFGIPFQFTSHVGMEWEFIRHLKVGYRFQHMSNSQLSSSNPGLNMHLFGMSYQF
jgi:Lipid A 3-O-deacylase (PagL)